MAFETPNPSGSPKEKLEVPRKIWAGQQTAPWDRVLRAEGIDPDLAQQLARAFQKHSEQSLLDVEANYRALEHWGNIHTHAPTSTDWPGLLAEGDVATGDSVGHIRVLAKDTGTVVWDHNAAESSTDARDFASFHGSPELYAILSSGNLYKYSGAGAVLWTVSPQAHSNASVKVDLDENVVTLISTNLRKHSPVDGAVTWGPFAVPKCRERRLALDADGNMYTLSIDAADGLNKVDGSSGAIVWSAPSADAADTGGIVTGPDGRIYTCARQWVRAHEPDGTVMWTDNLGTTTSKGSMAYSNEGLVVSAGSMVYLVNPGTGAVLNSSDLGNTDAKTAVSADLGGNFHTARQGLSSGARWVRKTDKDFGSIWVNNDDFGQIILVTALVPQG